MIDQASGNVRDYTVFGLRVRSSLLLPELFPAAGEDLAEVTIRTGAVATRPGAEDGIHVDDDGLVLIIPEVAKFRISGGDSIVVEPIAGVPDRNVRLFLLGSAFGALLHQRGLLPLHANAVEVGGKAFAFMGRSGAGKSTLAAWFHDRSYLVLADDVCVVRFDAEGRARACPGLPRLRLWLDALELTGRELEGLKRSYIGQSAQLDKYDVPVESSAMKHDDVPVGGIYLLDEADRFEVLPLSGMDAAEAIFANTYRGAYVAAASTHHGHWQSAVALARSTPVYRVTRTMSFANFDRECEALLRHFAGD